MRLLSRMLHRLVRRGTLHVIDADGRRHKFRGEPPAPQVTIRLHDRRLHRLIPLMPDPVMGNAYVDGRLTVEEGTLADFMRLVTLNEEGVTQGPWLGFQEIARRLGRPLHQLNTRRLARIHVASHYDRPKDFYELFLDADLQYSCAYFADHIETLEEAQEAKKRHIAAKLRLKPGQRVLDIGCGWGGLSLWLAKKFAVEVTGITLSTEQHAVATARARDAGMSGRVSFELRDYREVRGPFDRLVSVGMLEHVGAWNYPDFFRHVHDLLARDGIALVHSIGRKGSPTTTSAWVRKRIFPGSYIPALSEVFAAVERQRLWVTDVEVLRLHYAETLKAWRERFLVARPRIIQMYGEAFCRMWELYLTASEMAFRDGGQMVFQMQLSRDIAAVPLTRDYQFDAERVLAAQGAATERAHGVA